MVLLRCAADRAKMGFRWARTFSITYTVGAVLPVGHRPLRREPVEVQPKIDKGTAVFHVGALTTDAGTVWLRASLAVFTR